MDYKQEYIDVYKHSNKTVADLKDMEPNEATGYYLLNYPASTKRVILQDISEGNISSVIGYSVIAVIDILNTGGNQCVSNK